MSLFSSFNAGVAGLHASQSGLNTTAHNLANVKTPGYTRQQNINTDTYYQTIGTTVRDTLRVGMGTTVACVRQIRDQFLDRRYRTELGRQNFYEIQYTTEQEIEEILGEMEGVEFQDALHRVWNTVQSLSTTPDNPPSREVLISEMGSFIEKAGNVYQQLKNHQLSLNKQISENVDKVNELADQIAYYNGQIARIEAGGIENANDYRDTRNYLMDELSKYTFYEYAEHPNGQVEIRINNAPLVDAETVYHMKCEKMKEIDPDTGDVIFASSMYKVVWERNGFGEIYNVDVMYGNNDEATVGILPGILAARGDEHGYYTDIPVKPKREDFQTDDDYDTAKAAYNEELEKYNNKTANCLLQKLEAQFDLLVHQVITTVNDAFAPNVSLDINMTPATYTDMDGNEFTLDGTQKFLDVLHCPVGSDDDQTMGTEVFSRKNTERYTILKFDHAITATDSEGNNVTLTKDNGDGTYSLYVYNQEDRSDRNTQYTLQNVKMNQKLEANYSYLPVMGNPAIGQSGTYIPDVYKNLLETWSTRNIVMDPTTLTAHSVDSYYDAMVGDLATMGNVWKSIVENQTAEVQEIEGKRQQQSGVSTEEELVSLLTYQHAYNAASRYITTVDSMLQFLIERLG